MMSNKTVISYILYAIIFIVVSCTSKSAKPPDHQLSSSPDLIAHFDGDSVSSARNASSKATVGKDSLLALGRRNAITEAVQKVSPAVVSITVTEVIKGSRRVYRDFFRYFVEPTEREYSSMGSGFIISKDGLIVTNQHVANENAKKIVVSLANGSQYQAKIIGIDELTDLALLKIQGDHPFPFIQFGNSNDVMVGEWSLAVGNPFGLFKAAQPSVTVGVVSALHRDFHPNPNKPRVYQDMIQTDAAINSGNSGGPLVDSEGRVIGVNTFIYTGGTSQGFVGLGFAIPSNRVKKILHEISTGGKVKMKYDLGMRTQPMTYKLALQNNLPGITGLFVNSVNRDGPAFKGGIVPGDVIVKIGDERVQSQLHAQALFREYDVGDTMRVQLYRDDKLYQAKIKLRPKVSEH